jgi:hypothetical protein
MSDRLLQQNSLLFQEIWQRIDAAKQSTAVTINAEITCSTGK